MLSSLLLYLGGAKSASEIISLGVDLATRHGARIRGLTLLDTRRFTELATTCESAAYCTAESGRLSRVDRTHDDIRLKLSTDCLKAGINFDVRRLRGDPFEVLPRECQFHDLVITGFQPSHDWAFEQGLTASEVTNLIWHGVQPLLVLRSPPQLIRRVLLVTDGMPAAAKAIRQYLSQELFPTADHRLLAIGETDHQAKELLRELAEYGRGQKKPRFESGWLRGSVRSSLLAYAEKWQADLVVTGIARRNPVLRTLQTEMTEQILRKTSMGLYVMG
ncbi:universal stress protein [Anatilimnocola sp. NA78]|uniref:universal stress protein n=1 Tax=Anatilimnocola sp. NA78 TaxID=3415683 RepID=UPI003CE502CE